MECGEAGYLGAITAKKLLETKREKISVTTPILKTVKSTVFKVKPIASSQLNDSEKFSIPGEKEFAILAYDPIRGHLRVALRNESYGGYSVLYVWGEHAEIYENGNLVYPKPIPSSYRLNVPYNSQ